LIEYVDKILKYAGDLPCLRQHRGKIAAGAFSSEGRPIRVKKTRQIKNLEPGKEVGPARAFRRIVRPDMNSGFQ
jgi:hypothetical protein